MKDWQVKHLIADFKESQKGVKALLILHVFLSFVLLVFVNSGFSNQRFLFLSLTVLLLICGSFYNWEKLSISVFIIFIYLILVVLEYFYTGLPHLLNMDYNQPALSKGILMQMVIAIVPYIYLPLRFCFAFYLVRIVYLQQKIYQFKVM